MKKYRVYLFSFLSLLNQEGSSMERELSSIIEHPRFGTLNPLSQEDFKRMVQTGELEFRFYGIPHWTIFLKQDPFFAKKYEEGQKQHERFYRACEKSAQEKDPLSLFHLGILSYYGAGTHRDSEKALKLFQEAAHQGNPDAQYALGVLLFPSAYKDSFRFFEQAAAQGNERAQYNVGLMCLGGYGCEPDWPRAFKIMESLKFLEASIYKDLMSLIGLGTPQGSSKAFENLKGKEYHKVASQILFQVYLKNQEENLAAKDSLAHCYLEGKGCPKNFLKSRELFEEAAEKGHSSAYFNAAMGYLEEDSIFDAPQSFQRALELLRKGASLGDKECLFRLGKLYETQPRGEGMAPDFHWVLEFYYKAALIHKEEEEKESPSKKINKFSSALGHVFHQEGLWCHDEARSRQWLSNDFVPRYEQALEEDEDSPL